jgi:putative membrane-bound dehydrogenase-like protein
MSVFQPQISFFLAACAAVLGEAAFAQSKHPKYGFPLYTNVPAGNQMSGQWKAAGNPAYSPADAQKAFRLPAGFEMRLFAAEPDIANPVAMTWDDRGRLWVLELYEYPLGAKPGEKGRDRIKILEDTDGDGRVDSVKVFADGLSLATGLLVANNGVYVGQAPHLYFMQDTDGDDVADKTTVVQTGFGLEDRHELLNGFTWGPDGQMYMTHGVFTQTKAVNPDAANSPPVAISAGVARFNPKNRRMEVFAEGTSNPWGVDFDSHGNAFVSACVIDHFFHLQPGGLYSRQAGQPPYHYAYELLPSIVDHKHHMAAYAGVCLYQGDQWPAEWKGEVLMGNIHQNAINHDHLDPRGSTFSASKRDDFVTTPDGWFMPVSTQVGPDGAVWVMDWYDKYPCYQNAGADPAGVDRERGRIWRIVWVGDQPGKAVASHPAGLNLGKTPTPDLVKALAHPNVWQRRMAQRVLSGRADIGTQKETLSDMARKGPNVETKLSALWTLYSSGLADTGILDAASDSPEAAVRQWSARFTGELHDGSEEAGKRLLRLASDAELPVRAAVATAIRQHTSGSLTVNTDPPLPMDDVGPAAGALLGALIESSKDTTDRDLPFLIWMAAEPLVVGAADDTLKWYIEHGAENMPLAGKLLTKTIRRYCDTKDLQLLDDLADFLGKLPDDSGMLAAALDGLIEGQRGKAQTPRISTEQLIAKLLKSASKEVAARAQQLGALWGDASAFKSLLAKIADANAPEAERIKGIQAARQSKTEEVSATLLAVASSPAPDSVRVEAVHALGEAGSESTGPQLLSRWDSLSPAARRATAELLASKTSWALQFLAAAKSGAVKRGDVPPTVLRNLATHKNEAIRNESVSVFGHFHASSAEKLKLIAQKRRIVIDGPVDIEAGHQVAKKTCFVCHKLHGEGAEIGPDLTGVGRSSLDALLHNVINPNEIIGQGYENVEVETKDGRTISGRMVENSANRVRILMAGPQEEVIGKTDVKEVRISENSVMPEGLEQMPDQDFRNLIWFILAPPQDGKSLTPDRKKEFIGGSGDSAFVPSNIPSRDGESIALWSPGWQVDCPDFEGAPAKYPEFGGRANVLMTHPYDTKTPAAIVRAINLPAGQKTVLSFVVAAHERGDWDLRILADGEVLKLQRIGHDGDRWKPVRIDLSNYAGRRIVLRLENAANDWSWEFGYWADLKLESSEYVSR